MKILALEFSSSERSVAVAADDLARGFAQERDGRATHAFALIDSALQQAGVAREEIDCLAVGIGPGSYTGIRIAIAIAQGWQLAREIKLLGISSADCIAAQARERGIRGKVKIVFDAQQGEFFFARYELSELSCTQIEPFRSMTEADWSTAGDIVLRADTGKTTAEAETIILPDARTLALLATSRTDFVSGSSLEPLYLRKATFVKSTPPRKITE